MEKKKRTYTDCNRCGERMQISGDGKNRVIDYQSYKNGILCFRCSKIRQFDDDNPILYPKDN